MASVDFQLSFLYQTSLVLFLSAMFHLVVSRIFSRWVQDNSAPARGELVNALRIPVLATPWIIFLLFLVHGVIDHETAGWHDNLLLVENTLLILMPGWMFWLMAARVNQIISASSTVWASTISGSTLSRTCQLLVVITVLASIAKMLGYSFSTLLAFGGVGGIVLGFAAKEWLANFFGGLMLMLDKPFTEGDWIRSPDRSIEGHVELIGWRLTRIRTFDRRPLYVPNSLFTGIVVENPSRMRNRRMVENFGLRYEDMEKLPFVLNRILDQLKLNPDIDAGEPLYACFIRYDDSSLLCQVRVHIKRTDRVGFLQVQQWVLLMIAEAVAEQGAEFAYPTRRLISENADIKQ